MSRYEIISRSNLTGLKPLLEQHSDAGCLKVRGVLENTTGQVQEVTQLQLGIRIDEGCGRSITLRPTGAVSLHRFRNH